MEHSVQRFLFPYKKKKKYAPFTFEMNPKS